MCADGAEISGSVSANKNWNSETMRGTPGIQKANPMPSAGVSQTLGACMTWTATFRNGAWIGMGLLYPAEPVKDPTGAMSGSCRVYRGGACIHGAGRYACNFRNWDTPGIQRPTLGFRFAKTPA